MLPSWVNDTIDAEEPTWVEERGKQVKTYLGFPIAVPGCSVQPGAATTDLALRDNVRIAWTVFVPPGVAISRHAKITWQGEDYMVDGAPLPWRSPLGGLDHTVLALVRWEG